MKDINLISQFQQQKKDPQISVLSRRLGIACLIVLAISLLSYGVLAFLQFRLGTKETLMQKTIKEAIPIVTLKNNIRDKQNSINQLSKIVDLVTARSIIDTKILDGIAKVMPDNVFLVNYSVDQSGNLNIMGKSKDMDSIAYFISKLKGTGLFSNVYLSNLSGGSSNGNQNVGSSGYNFAVLLTLVK